MCKVDRDTVGMIAAMGESRDGIMTLEMKGKGFQRALYGDCHPGLTRQTLLPQARKNSDRFGQLGQLGQISQKCR